MSDTLFPIWFVLPESLEVNDCLPPKPRPYADDARYFVKLVLRKSAYRGRRTPCCEAEVRVPSHGYDPTDVESNEKTRTMTSTANWSPATHHHCGYKHLHPLAYPPKEIHVTTSCDLTDEKGSNGRGASPGGIQVKTLFTWKSKRRPGGGWQLEARRPVW
jgi:hypothetical protein